jgi:dimethylargininase
MLTALTRGVSPTIDACELTWITREKIDIDRAVAQHKEYENCLRGLGIRVISLAAEPDLPDAMFVEDPLLVFDEVAIITRMGCASRRPESETLAAAIAPFRPVRRITEPATLEGGDVLRAGRDVFAGLSSRTNEAGISQLAREIEPFGYRVHAVEVRGCLHLKSACCSLGDRGILANRAWIDTTRFRDFDIVDVPEKEPAAANVLRVGDAVLAAAAFSQTAAMLAAMGLEVRTVDISELMKAEAAITCSSVIFDHFLSGIVQR